MAFDPATDTVTNTIQLGVSEVSDDFAVRPDGREIYVPDYWGDAVVVVSTASHSVVVARIPVGKHAAGTVRLVDIRTSTVVRTVFEGRMPSSVTVTPDGERLYVTIDGIRGIAVVQHRARPTVRAGPAESGSSARSD